MVDKSVFFSLCELSRRFSGDSLPEKLLLFPPYSIPHPSPLYGISRGEFHGKAKILHKAKFREEHALIRLLPDDRALPVSPRADPASIEQESRISLSSIPRQAVRKISVIR